MKSRIFNISLITEFVDEQDPAELAQLVLKALQSNGMPKGMARIDVQGFDEREIAEQLSVDDQLSSTQDQIPDRSLN